VRSPGSSPVSRSEKRESYSEHLVFCVFRVAKLLNHFLDKIANKHSRLNLLGLWAVFSLIAEIDSRLPLVR
jgi:hypothetical protein